MRPTERTTDRDLPPKRRALRRAVWTWLITSVIGGSVVALPDEGPRLFSISETHGPAALDVVGIVILLAGYAPFLLSLWRARAEVRFRPLVVILALVGAFELLWSLLGDVGAWWVLGVVLLTAAQLLAAGSVLARR